MSCDKSTGQNLYSNMYIKQFVIAVAFRIKISMLPYFVFLFALRRMHFEVANSNESILRIFNETHIQRMGGGGEVKKPYTFCIQFSREQNPVSKGFHKILFGTNFAEREGKGGGGQRMGRAYGPMLLNKNIFGTALTDVLIQNRMKLHKNREFTQSENV